jgi:actin related protein 2/3 complex, subunit 1A/1B
MAKKIFKTITAISFNADGSQVALCEGSKEIFIYDTNGSKDCSKWEKRHTLKEHTQKAAVIDWNHKTGLILTGSYDRSIFVWKYNEEHKKYLPEFVNMDEKLAILDLKWNVQGTKFVVGTSSKRIFIGYFSAKNDWWTTSEIKKQHKSSVLSVEFSPNGRVIASASFDGTCKILSAVVKDVDTEESKSAFGTVEDFGECLIEYKCMFWLNNVTWSPSGSAICYCSHDGTLNFCDLTGGEKGKITKYTHKGLPFSKGRFIDEDSFLAVGYDKAPFLFTKDGDEWKQSKILDPGFESFRDYSVESGSKNNQFFKLKEVESDIQIPEKLKLKERDTLHENTIQQLLPFKGDSRKEMCT